MAKFGLDEAQADAILKMQLRRLAALEHRKIQDERDALAQEVERLTAILASEASILAEIRKELVDISARFGDERRTRIGHATEILEKEDLIEDKPMLVSLTSSNYVKGSTSTPTGTSGAEGAASSAWRRKTMTASRTSSSRTCSITSSVSPTGGGRSTG